ncbi:MAG: tRNA lysidine(34) synthetase TilS [Methyloceanibacter sp.]|uniref:tRNA lysidine(34) synthetase TilS n=1 Tax=Methyloceanibacter sp. TaxID=1965321 RepID=UPI003D6C917C
MRALPISRSEAKSLLAPLARFPRVALAVSGGPDSLALMHLAARWRMTRRTGPEISVLTVDHGLRAGSRDEVLMVGRIAKSLRLPHAILAWEHHGDVGTSVQVRARVARYDLMAAYCHAHDIPALVTAHHLDDQAETFLMRLRRGSGLDGLAAIPEQGSWAGLKLLRPLLDVPKARLVATVEQAGLKFAVDPSNGDERFERARLRRNADAFAALGLTPEAVALSARRLRRAREALETAARDFLFLHSETCEAGYAVVDLAALRSAPEEIALRGLSRLIAAVGGGEEPMRLVKLEALLAALKAEPGKAHTLGRCRIEPRGGQLGIFREMRKQGLPELKLKPGERTLWDNRFKVELGQCEAAPITVRALGEAGLRTLRERQALPEALPRLAARTLPACWRGERLIGLPALGPAPFSCHEVGLDCRATFLRGTA